LETKIRILGKMENRKITRGEITGNKKKMRGVGGGVKREEETVVNSLAHQ